MVMCCTFWCNRTVFFQNQNGATVTVNAERDVDIIKNLLVPRLLRQVLKNTLYGSKKMVQLRTQSTYQGTKELEICFRDTSSFPVLGISYGLHGLRI